MTARLYIIAVCCALAYAGIQAASRPEHIAPRMALASFPLTLSDWTGKNEQPFTPQVLKVLGADEYVNRTYIGPQGVVGLYLGYYQSQREGDAIHSPLNCLPGAGWEPLSKARLDLDVDGRPGAGPRKITVNRFVIQKGMDRNLVLYWYQSHGRVVASEYSSKVLMVWDSIRLNRTDAALVRVIAPIRDGQSVDMAEATAVAFVRQAFPRFVAFLPS